MAKNKGMAPSFRFAIDAALAVARGYWYLRGARSLGKKVRVWGRPIVKTNGRLLVRDRVRISSRVARTELVAEQGGTLEIGESAYINYGCSISASKLVRIGPRCNIGTYCMIIDNAFHELAPERRHLRPESRAIVLEENVWLGGRVIVLPGVTIGRDSVIGAGSVVTSDIPAGVVAAGVPARVIRSL
jgi:maltose O-acetyltransferase